MPTLFDPRLLAVLACAATAGTPAFAEPTALQAPPGGAWPIVIDRPGHYVLRAALVVPAGRGAIRVTAPDVVLDLAGHSVSGPGECRLNLRFAISCRGHEGQGAALGISVEPPARAVVVRNGVVRGFESGLSLAADGRLERLEVSHNSLAGVELRGGARVDVSELRAELNDTALYAADGRLRIERSQLRFNGIALWADPSSVLADSVVSDNGQALKGMPLLSGSRISANGQNAGPQRF